MFADLQIGIIQMRFCFIKKNLITKKIPKNMLPKKLFSNQKITYFSISNLNSNLKVKSPINVPDLKFIS